MRKNSFPVQNASGMEKQFSMTLKKTGKYCMSEELQRRKGEKLLSSQECSDKDLKSFWEKLEWRAAVEK